MLAQGHESDAYAAPDRGAVGGLLRRGAKWSVGLLVGRQIIGVVTTGIVARVLPASDFGMVAMVGTMTGLLTLVSDMGLSWATVQADRLRQDQVDTLFWVGSILGALAWAACAASAPALARLYHTPELVPLCVVFGSGLLVAGMAIQPTALLKRRMRQRELALSQLSASIIASIVSVVLARAGARYWALALQNITAAVVVLVTSFLWSGYRPVRPKLSAGALSLIRFGGYTAACNISTYFQISLDSILIGRYCGASELGLYSRAYYLRTLPAMYAAMALTDAMVPALSALQGDRERLKATFTKAVRLVAFAGCPIAVLLATTANETVRLVYGPAWAPVARLLILLSFPALMLPLMHVMGWLFVATGNVRKMFILSVSTLPLVVVFYYQGTAWGATGVALAAALLFTIPIPLLQVYFAHSAAQLPLKPTFHAIAPIFLASAGAAAAALAVGASGAAFGWAWPLVFLVKLVAGTAIYLLLAIFMVRPLPVSELERVAELSRGFLLSHMGASKKTTLADVLSPEGSLPLEREPGAEKD